MAKTQAKPLPRKQGIEAGILPVQAIRGLIAAGHVCPAEPLAADQLQPASLDLRLGPWAYRVRAASCPVRAERLPTSWRTCSCTPSIWAQGAVLETGCVYLAPLLESMALPAALAAATNPKSSTGRLDVFTRVIADGVGAFDQIPAGYQGPSMPRFARRPFPSSCARARG